MYGDIHVVSDI